MDSSIIPSFIVILCHILQILRDQKIMIFEFYLGPELSLTFFRGETKIFEGQDSRSKELLLLLKLTNDPGNCKTAIKSVIKVPFDLTG